MAILGFFPQSSMVGSPFTDYLNVTTPAENTEVLKDRLIALVESLGPCTESEPGSFVLHDLHSGAKSRGSFRLRKRGKVLMVSASGGCLAALRDAGRFSDYLVELSEVPHRVSMMHCTQDYAVPCTSAAVLGVRDAAYRGDLALTRKRLVPGQVKCLLGLAADGLETGTVYLGNRANADVWAKVYDKRHERLSRGFPDHGPIVRVEVAVQSDVGATLRDAFEPAALFWHFAGRSLVEPPAAFAGWVPGGEGFVLGPRREISDLDRLETLMSFDRGIHRLVDAAVSAYGDLAGDVLARLFRKSVASRLGFACKTAGPS